MKRMLLLSCVEYFYPKINQIFGDKFKDMNVLCIPTAAYAEDDQGVLVEDSFVQIL